MVLDALAAVSLASSVIQVIDFGSKLCAKGFEIRNSAEGMTKRYTELGLASSKLSQLTADLENAMRIKDAVEQLDREEQRLMELAQASYSVSQKLQTALEALKTNGLSAGKWKSLGAALKQCWSDGAIHELESRMDALREQLSVELIMSMRYVILFPRHSTIEARIRRARDNDAPLRTSSCDNPHPRA